MVAREVAQPPVLRTPCRKDERTSLQLSQRGVREAKRKIKLEGEAGEPLEGRPLSWRDEGRQIWHEYLYVMGALREQRVALATETPDTCFCPLQSSDHVIVGERWAFG